MENFVTRRKDGKPGGWPRNLTKWARTSSFEPCPRNGSACRLRGRDTTHLVAAKRAAPALQGHAPCSTGSAKWPKQQE